MTNERHLEKKDKVFHASEKAANKVLHTKHKSNMNDDLVGAMHAMYTTPDPDTGNLRSLNHIAKVYRKTRQSVYGLFKTRGYPLRSKQLLGLQVFKGVKFTLHKEGYLRGTVNRSRVFMHHYVWKTYRGEIPKDHYIFHKDGDKKNNKIKNLCVLHRSKKPLR